MSKTILLDGDVFLYQAAIMEEKIADVQQGLGADRVVVALTHPENFRKEVMPTYKENRKDKRKPLVFKPMREYVQQEYETYIRPGLEGDDILGILSTHPKLVPGEKIIVSIDKDFGTIPGQWLNDMRARDVMREHGGSYSDYVQTITEEEADRFHIMQTIAGDPSDGYPGVPGFGLVKAEKLLDAGRVLVPTKHTVKSGPRKGEVEDRWVPGDEGTPWEIVLSAYKSAGLGEEVALQNARVARICRWRDWNFKEGKVRLWTP
jgi:DNA polymerase-1